MDIEGCGGVISCDDKDTAWRILGGYQINRNFAVELGYHQLGDASASFPGGQVDFEATAIELVGLGILPLANNFALYAKAGFYRGETEAKGNALGPVDVSETNTDLTFGPVPNTISIPDSAFAPNGSGTPTWAVRRPASRTSTSSVLVCW